ncbi:hypothetical protein [Salinihabitans flavidus]|nr:hypothetical protein [Salinihabitans flavidus]
MMTGSDVGTADPERTDSMETISMSTDQSSAQEGSITLTGEVVQGVTCPAIRLDDGRTVALSRLPSEFPIGTRVRVTGSGYAGSASCMQEVLVVTGAAAE